MRKFQESMELLKKLGLEPKTIVDAGVATGTPSLYSVYPNAYYFFFEPLEEFKPYLDNHIKKLKGEYHFLALSDKNGEIKISLPNKLGGASILNNQSSGRLIKTIQLDSFFDGKLIKTPLLIKTDCQGADLLVMKGAEKTIQNCEVVVMEVQMSHYFSGRCPDFTDVVSCMGQYGFRVFDLVDPLNRPSDGALGQIDVVFVKSNSDIIKNSKW